MSNTTPATFPEDLEKARPLFSVSAGSMNRDPSFQYFSKELASLTGNYALPIKDILLARNPHGEAAECCRGAFSFLAQRLLGDEETIYLA